MNKLELSIIIPCFNCDKTLREAVDSCYTQGLGAETFEIVLVDDGSTDMTRDLIQTLAKEKTNIRYVFHEKNQGGGAARNTAVANSRAEIIFCLDSDDILAPDTLTKMLALQRDKQCDVVGIEKSIKFRGSNINDVDVVHQFGYVGEKIPFESLLQKDAYCPLYSTFMFTKEAFAIAGGYPTDHGFDTQGIAWRFLATARTAYACPGAVYLHRVAFNKSYYIREYESGKANLNWLKILSEFSFLFDHSTQQYILNFDVNSDENLFESIRVRSPLFVENYRDLIGPQARAVSIDPRFAARIREIEQAGLRKRGSQAPLISRIIHRLKRELKKRPHLRHVAIQVHAIPKRLTALMSEQPARRAYYAQIDTIKKNKELVARLDFGGIGDCLIWSGLPEALSKQFGIEFYLSSDSRERIRHTDTFKLCFEMNPFFKGLRTTDTPFIPRRFESEKSLLTFITDRNAETIVEMLERQFGLTEKCGRPKLYYTPRKLEPFTHTILIDKNMISGKKFGWHYRDNVFEKEAEKYRAPGDQIVYVEPSAQDFWTYIDMIYSCKHFIATFSGGASIAAALDASYTVIWPINACDTSNYQFAYSGPRVRYTK